MFYSPGCGLAWWMFHASLRICLLLLLDEVFHKCQLSPVNGWGCSVQLCPPWHPARWLCQLLLEECCVSSSPDGFVCFSLQRVLSASASHILTFSCLAYVPQGLFMSSWKIDPFFSMQCCLLFLIIFAFVLKCTLSENKITTAVRFDYS